MKLKKLKILEELHYSGMTSEGTEYLCIEQLSSNQYLLDIRHRETIGDLENWREDYLNKLKKMILTNGKNCKRAMKDLIYYGRILKCQKRLMVKRW
tara:strand:- start:1794 stop:2081 length:288 start_codon:yes stop_codon:yes gene_type:complete